MATDERRKRGIKYSARLTEPAVATEHPKQKDAEPAPDHKEACVKNWEFHQVRMQHTR